MPTSDVFGRQAEPKKDQRSYVKLRNGYMKTGGMVVDMFPGGIELEMLSTSGMKFGDNVELHLADAGAPTLIRQNAQSPALYVLMPMRV